MKAIDNRFCPIFIPIEHRRIPELDFNREVVENHEAVAHWDQKREIQERIFSSFLKREEEEFSSVFFQHDVNLSGRQWLIRELIIWFSRATIKERNRVLWRVLAYCTHPSDRAEILKVLVEDLKSCGEFVDQTYKDMYFEEKADALSKGVVEEQVDTLMSESTERLDQKLRSARRRFRPWGIALMSLFILWLVLSRFIAMPLWIPLALSGFGFTGLVLVSLSESKVIHKQSLIKQ